jgi:hypothetical protein
MANQILHIHDPAFKPEKTADLRLAASLLTMGIPTVNGLMGVTTRKENDSGSFRTFHFGPVSADGRFRTADLCAAWRAGKSFCDANQAHPFATSMATHLNHLMILEHVRRGSELVMVRRGQSIALISADADARTEEEIIGRF